jgi:hypothetical protein
MNEDVAVSIDPRDGIEHLISRMESDNRFDKLVSVRDIAQVMIGEEREKEEAALKALHEELAAKLSSTRERERNLNKIAKAQKPRAPRKARTPKVPATTKHVKAKGTGTVSSAA